MLRILICGRLLLAVVWLATAAGSAQAAKPASVAKLANEQLPLEIKFGPASSVTFQVSIFGMFKKNGSFGEFRGALLVQANTARVTARIQTASTRMKSQSDATLLKSPAYFDAAHFPEITFQSDRFPVATLRNGGQISGKLTVRGITQRQIFKLTAKTCHSSFAHAPWRCGFNVTGTLKRSQFGMRARRGIVSEEVALTLEITPPEAKVPTKTQNSGKL